MGPTNDRHPAVAAYHRLLVWDIEKAPKVTRTADRVLNPLVGKSLVVYCQKPGTGPVHRRRRRDVCHRSHPRARPPSPEPVQTLARTRDTAGASRVPA